MGEGRILKALSGFYYVYDGQRIITCRARGKHRYANTHPLVGDQVGFTMTGEDTGALDEIYPRKNEFQRPAVANIDQLVLIVSGTIPVTDPFLIDRLTSIAAAKDCACIICINKCDLDAGDELFAIYNKSGFPTLRVSAMTGEGMDTLKALIANKVSAFTGNSGVGKSSILNALEPEFHLATGQISQKLGRGRHTTRHVELFRLGHDAVVADTPGFSSFDAEKNQQIRKEDLAQTFCEFRPYLQSCQFVDCSHTKEKGCALLQALGDGVICTTRHASYLRLYEQARQIPDWTMK